MKAVLGLGTEWGMTWDDSVCSLAFCCFLSSSWMLSGVGLLLSQFHPSRCGEPRENVGHPVLLGPFQLLWLEGPVSRLGP